MAVRWWLRQLRLHFAYYFWFAEVAGKATADALPGRRPDVGAAMLAQPPTGSARPKLEPIDELRRFVLSEEKFRTVFSVPKDVRLAVRSMAVFATVKDAATITQACQDLVDKSCSRVVFYWSVRFGIDLCVRVLLLLFRCAFCCWLFSRQVLCIYAARCFLPPFAIGM